MSQRQFTALVIDDNEDNCEIFRLTLQKSGYSARSCDVSTEGLALLEKEAFDLLLIDLQMPYLSGSEILRRIRDLPHLKKMKRIVITANSHMLNEELDELADYVMQKPIDVLDFGSFVQRLQNT